MEKLQNVTPGDILQELWLKPLNMSVTDFAKKVNISLDIAQDIFSGKKKITLDIAQKLHTSLGNSVEFWLGIQEQYEEDELADALERLEYMAHTKRENIQNNKGKQKEDFQDLKELVDTICKI